MFPRFFTALLVLTFAFSPLSHAKNDKEKKLPPGLQKKQDRGQALPPGWQKKVQVGQTLDKQVYDQGQVVLKDSDRGLITIRVEGKLIKLVQKTREVVEILDSM